MQYLPVHLFCEMDEMWSFVGNKKRQRWLWYAWSPQLKRIVTHVFVLTQSSVFAKIIKTTFRV
ncbi:hypothetical protein EUX53_27285 [Pseudomonas orientalis]|nr:hypothetical protein [Bacillus subtilis]RZI17806.1 hypothetical protein EUX53_27285 [Pseudomonas orientalis]